MQPAPLTLEGCPGERRQHQRKPKRDRDHAAGIVAFDHLGCDVDSQPIVGDETVSVLRRRAEFSYARSNFRPTIAAGRTRSSGLRRTSPRSRTRGRSPIRARPDCTPEPTRTVQTVGRAISRPIASVTLRASFLNSSPNRPGRPIPARTTCLPSLRGKNMASPNAPRIAPLRVRSVNTSREGSLVPDSAMSVQLGSLRRPRCNVRLQRRHPRPS